jgi:DNA-binding MarR family transcriptional regulator
LPSRTQLLKALDEAVRKVGAQSVLISDLVAARVGINSTDLECLDLLYLAGPTTAGRIASHTGLTTGATTAVIDRLERAGFVTRRRDLRDRRVVVIDVVRRSASLIEPFYAPLVAGFARVHKGYDVRKLATCVDYLTHSLQVGAEHVAWLQTQTCLSRARRRHASPGPLSVPGGIALPGTKAPSKASGRVAASRKEAAPSRKETLLGRKTP